ncbi:unnamed protein product [Caenorhabditis angaria]|uniref:Uncharacterized protein n=1 Tax=Caenorhabditis angaria TaxID=860376 RepID=A0A9P1N329_9PELO|nr:unnamed protein product [Caenorhabditis angaria]
MVEEHLAKSGLFVDDFNKLRLIDPEVAEILQGAHDKSKEFNDQLRSFYSTTGGLIESIEEFAKIVETEKIRAMMVRNSAEKDLKAEDPVILQMTIRELSVEKERLRIELEAIKKIEKEQENYIQTLMEN